MIRFILLLAFIFAILIIRQQIKNTPQEKIKSLYWKLLFGGLGIVLVLLAATGRIHWIGAMIGALLPFLRRVTPFLIRYFPQIHHYHKTRTARPSQGNQSQVKTQVLDMTLDHDSNRLNGTVIEGPFTGNQLDSMEIDQLRSLLDYCYQQETQSADLLISYLQHRFGDSWQSTPANTNLSLDIDAAYAILGLKPGASKDEVIKAHRSMMQKMHPDRGGSDYLAAQINEAKTLIINQLT